MGIVASIIATFVFLVVLEHRAEYVIYIVPSSIVIAVLLIIPILLIVWGARGDGGKGKLLCPKCRYDMRGTFKAGSLACPECGHVAQTIESLTKVRRRIWAYTLGITILSIYLILTIILVILAAILAALFILFIYVLAEGKGRM